MNRKFVVVLDAGTMEDMDPGNFGEWGIWKK